MMFHPTHAAADPNILRVLVVGDTGVGKTLFIRRLCHQAFAFSSGSAGSSPAALNGRRGSTGGGGGGEGDPREDAYYFGSRWGPTIGFEVDALVREAYVGGEAERTDMRRGRTEEELAASTPARGSLTGYVAAAPVVEVDGLLTCRGSPGLGSASRQQSRMSYRGVESGPTSPVHTAAASIRGSRALHGEEDGLPPLTAPHGNGSGSGGGGGLYGPRPVQQTVELYELGGTRAFSPDSTLPLPLMDFDGIIFVYDRANASSTARLSALYAHMRRLFTRDPGADPQTAPKRPKLMLMGTQLEPSALSALLSNATGGGRVLADPDEDEELDEDGYLPSDDALLDPVVRLRAELQLSQRHSKRRRGRRGALSRRLRRWCLSFTIFAGLSLNPSLVLSEQYQEERSTRSFRWAFRLMETFAKLVLAVERIIVSAMAVVLFGVNQDVASVRQPNVRAALECIKEDPYFVTQCHVCRLYSRFAFESSVEEISNFFDAVHRGKLSQPA